MTIYYVVYSILLIVTIVDLFIQKESKKSLIIPIVILALITILMAGFRWETGTDWRNYINFFRMIEKIPIGKSHMEIGYEFIVRFSKLFFGGEYTFFLLFFATLITTLNSTTLYKLSPYPIFSLFLFMSYSPAGSIFGVRQDISLCLTLLSFIFIQQRSFPKFILLVFLATLLHKSAIVFFPAYYLYNLKWNVLTVLAVLLVIAISFFLSGYLIQTIGSIIAERKTEFYMELGQEVFEDSYTSLLKGLSGRILFLLLLLPMVNYSDDGDKVFNGLFNLYVFGIILYTIFTHLNPIFSRIARSYDMFQILAIPLAYYNASRRYKIVFLGLVFAFSIYKFTSTIKNDPGVLVPYKTIFDQ
ncbi:EpsG family protein [Dyadobacter crusticola]|uniref:EpsG family protein n=1 Tax=Dyadobacter crusticola TaxID=292407 RepID=UPI000A6ED10C|nr:EpsG family protein [Dyadobacter crusticola]